MAKSLTKTELIDHVASRMNVGRPEARRLLTELTELAERELKRSGEFVIPGVVTLVVRERKARTGRNPATGQPIEIAAKTVVKARIAPALKGQLLSAGPEGEPFTPKRPPPLKTSEPETRHAREEEEDEESESKA
jgi:DNA-binding protein HU-beta